jgi:hypothetical protein
VPTDLAPSRYPKPKPLTDADRRALQLAIDLARADPSCGDVDDQISRDGWLEVGKNYAYSLQMDNLHLRPWQYPPCWLLDFLRLDDPDPDPPDIDGIVAGKRLLRQMLALDVSRFHPDPQAAIAEALRNRG